MQQVRLLPIVLLIATASLTIPTGSATAQIAPVPNGCSVPFVPLFVANGLDAVFLSSCDRHDLCYGTANPATGPCFGFGTKASCDINFLIDMEAVCTFYGSILAFPASGWVDVGDFLEDCSIVAGTFFTAVVVGGDNAFMTRQCLEGCNRDMCTALGAPFLGCLEPGCGQPPALGPDEQCLAILADTGTWILGPNGVATPAPEQLAFPLSRKEKRPGDLSIYMDEWALLSIGAGKTAAWHTSDAGFAERAAAAAIRTLPTHMRDTELVIIEAAIHKQNGREIPTPTLIPFETDLGPLRPPGASALWFRAELDHSGNVDHFAFLHPKTEPWIDAAEHALSSNLRLSYVDTRRHRAIVYGLAHIDEQGHLALRDLGFVTIPQCCCEWVCEW